MHATTGADHASAALNGGVLPLDRERMFADHKGRYKKSIEKRQTKLLKKVPPLSGILEEGEQVAFVTTGCTPTSVLEQIFTGWIFIYIKRCVLVFTNKRIIHIPTKIDYSYRNSIAQIRYTDCKQIKLRGSRLRIRYRNKKIDDFLFIARRERKKIKALILELAFDESPATDVGRKHLCPRCAAPLEKAVYMCRQCRLPFKSRAEVRKWAIWLPGGGYFYTRHPLLGLGDAFVELVLIALVVLAAADTVNGVEGGAERLVFVSILLLIEKLVSVYHSNHFVEEYLTEEKNPVYYQSTAAG